MKTTVFLAVDVVVFISFIIKTCEEVAKIKDYIAVIIYRCSKEHSFLINFTEFTGKQLP